MMRAGVPRIPSDRLWRSREAKCLAVITRALDLFRERAAFPDSEIELNRLFYFCLLAASRELYPDDEVAPVTECCNQPDPDDDSRARREQKRPDFQWVYLDRYESDPLRSSKQFVVECKRLGEPPRADWVLNFNYIEHGIVRFRHPDWAYAKRAQSGAMVGYMQSMTPETILAAVNAECQRQAFPDLTPTGAWVAGATTQLGHSFDRGFAISPIRLHHFWIDLRVQP
ncbi:hypothetical protein [Bradyrhizobium sp. NBAIM01]|uniref:hypothetical protein n=1 Tax=Bradyrhizobium sp. NBAIM01 TaxID=2793818 RepID=UPI001CD7F89A|nr:hypothetical protein [Bradyrhizobium sp. NBAIM01]MCA1510453.1 hypothetical protein [Bradyrhizobium sp. NBAIM01]